MLDHRGPDQRNHWFRDNVGLGHTRLAIIDLSPAATQPLHGEDQLVHLVINGEIYNYRELKSDLIAREHRFNSDSDSEVLWHGYEEWGIRELLTRVNGMFSLAIYDENREELLLAREVASALGTDHTEMFCSEQDALEIVPQLTEMYGEPFADTSAIPTHLLSRLTREHVVVALSGDGGDEISLGYDRYRKAERLSGLMNIPGRSFAGSLLQRITGTGSYVNKLTHSVRNFHRGSAPLAAAYGSLSPHGGKQILSPMPPDSHRNTNSYAFKLGKALEIKSFSEMCLVLSGIFHPIYYEKLPANRLSVKWQGRVSIGETYTKKQVFYS